MVAGGRAEVPDDRLGVAAEQREPDELVHRPRADVGGGHVADVREVEGEDRADIRTVQCGLQPGEPLPSQPVEVDALFPVDCVHSKRADRHVSTPLLQSGCSVVLTKS
jgi:hypothetical protein